MSGGEKQKIAIARLLVNPNPIILLDESFSNIDIASSKMILNSLSKLELKPRNKHGSYPYSRRARDGTWDKLAS